MQVVLSILLVALVATVADYTWYTLGVEHRMVAGIVHGVVLLTAVGGVLGWAAGRLAVGLPLGMAAGAGGALAYYALAPALGGLGAMVAAWAMLWVLLAFFDGRILRRGATGPSGMLARGVAAAILGGLAFYLVVDMLWGRPPAGGRNYVVQFAAWTFAWAPGLAVVMIRKP
ncbi:MAG TPA: hypothetical protein VMM93_11380 [Vicinamibacterales bacterium]|nr:hypothetical protein [Vicinamibacterales bacterium]